MCSASTDGPADGRAATRDEGRRTADGRRTDERTVDERADERTDECGRFEREAHTGSIFYARANVVPIHEEEEATRGRLKKKKKGGRRHGGGQKRG